LFESLFRLRRAPKAVVVREPTSRPVSHALPTIQVRLKGAQLILSSSQREGVHVDGPAIVETVAEGTLIRERLPAKELKPTCRVEVPTGAIVEVSIEWGALLVLRFDGIMRARLTRGSARVEFSGGRVRIVAVDGSVALERVHGTVDVLTNSGSISARQINGDVQAVTNGGAMTFEQIDGALVARSTNGSIDASGLNGVARLSARTGSIRVSGAARQLKVRTQSGDVSLEGSIVEHTTIETFKGNVDVRLGPSTDARLEASARQGIVRTKRIFAQPGTSRRALRSTLGGGRARLRITAGMGVIEITGPQPSSGSSTRAIAAG
jgi:hypothetical protein